MNDKSSDHAIAQAFYEWQKLPVPEDAEIAEYKSMVEDFIGERAREIDATPQEGAQAVAYRWWSGTGWRYGERTPMGEKAYPLYTSPPALEVIMQSRILEEIREKMFPFTLYCTEQGWSAYEFRSVFLANKPEKESWYAYDVLVLSATEVTFVAFEIADSVHGGVGKEKFRFTVNVPIELTKKSVESRAEHVAEAFRSQELMEQEEKIIAKYKQQILDALN